MTKITKSKANEFIKNLETFCKVEHCGSILTAEWNTLEIFHYFQEELEKRDELIDFVRGEVHGGRRGTKESFEEIKERVCYWYSKSESENEDEY